MAKIAERLKATATIVLLLSAGIILNVNMSRERLRYDLTTDQRHTLSPVTKALLKKADQPFEIHAFLPSQLKSPHHLIVNGLRDTLMDFMAESDGRISIRSYDPTDPDSSEDERKQIIERARTLGIEPVSLDTTQNARRIRENVWIGVAILYGDRQVVAGPFNNAHHYEYALASAIKKLLSNGDQVGELALSTGNGEPPIASSPVGDLLKKIAPIRTVTLDEHLASRIKTLIILGPTRPFNTRQKYVLDQFLMRGGNLMLLLDHRIQIAQFPTMLIPMNYGLNELLKNYGLKIKTGKTVIDRLHPGQAPMATPGSGHVVPVSHPGFPRVRVTDSAHPITRTMDELVTPFASPIELTSMASVEHTTLLKSYETSVVNSNVRKVAPDAYSSSKPSNEEKSGSQVLAVLAQGYASSIFEGKDRPRHPSAQNPFAPGEQRHEPSFISRSRGLSQILLVTSGARFLGAHKNGLIFVQNAADMLMTDTSLASLRARRRAAPRLTDTDRLTRRTIRWTNIFGPILVLLLFGFCIRRMGRVSK